MLEKLAIGFISWKLRRQGLYDVEIVVRSDGDTVYKRNKEREAVVKRIVSNIK